MYYTRYTSRRDEEGQKKAGTICFSKNRTFFLDQFFSRLLHGGRMYVKICCRGGEEGIVLSFHSSSFPDISLHHYLKHDK